MTELTICVRNAEDRGSDGFGAMALEAAAAVSFAAAVFSDPVPRRVYDFSGSQGELFGRATSLGWSSDRGFLIAAIAFCVLGVVALVAAVRQR